VDTGGRASAADGDDRGMFAHEEPNLAVVPLSRLVNQPVLQRQDPIELDAAQQVGLDGWRAGLGLRWIRRHRENLSETVFVGKRERRESRIIEEARPVGKTPDGGHSPATSSRSGSTVKKPAKKPPGGNDPQRPIAQNRKARHNYDVLDTLECGIALVGSEVKSLRQGQVSLAEAYGRVKGGELWLLGCDIAEYSEANQFNHQPRRPRKLLLHRREIDRFAGAALQQGLTLVPLQMYFKRGRAKVLMGLCRGRKRHDKREAMKKAEARREIARHMHRR
jgi:SsrA-binding protein